MSGVTRYYFQSSGAPAVSPAFDASWGVTAGAVRLTCNPVPQLTPIVQLTRSMPGSTSQLFAQFVSPPIAAPLVTAQAFFGGFLRMGIQAGGLQAAQRLGVYKLTDGTGAVVKATFTVAPIVATGPPFASALLYVQNNSQGVSTNELAGFPAALFAINFGDGYVRGSFSLLSGPVTNILPDSLSIAAGDRFVFEVGALTSVFAPTGSVQIEIGDSYGVDLPVYYAPGPGSQQISNLTIPGNGWIDFVDQSGATGVGRMFGTTTGFFNQKA